MRSSVVENPKYSFITPTNTLLAHRNTFLYHRYTFRRLSASRSFTAKFKTSLKRSRWHSNSYKNLWNENY